jgi:hypothetical protein
VLFRSEEAYAAGFEDMHRRVPSLEKLARLAGFRPSTPLAQIVDRVVRHFQDQRELVASRPEPIRLMEAAGS